MTEADASDVLPTLEAQRVLKEAAESAEAEAKQDQRQQKLQRREQLVLNYNLLLQDLAADLDGVDSHFAEHPLHDRPLTQNEVGMILNRRRTVVTLRQIRDGADSLIESFGPAPTPFGPIAPIEC